MLPPFSEANVNSYLASIGSSASEINQFNADLNANWLGAFQTRFTLTPENVTLLTNFPVDGKVAILEAIALCARWASRVDIEFPIVMGIDGFSAPLALPSEIPIEFKFKFKGGTYYDENGNLEFTVKEARVEARVPLC